jgi:hypothetical protein
MNKLPQVSDRIIKRIGGMLTTTALQEKASSNVSQKKYSICMIKVFLE